MPNNQPGGPFVPSPKEQAEIQELKQEFEEAQGAPVVELAKVNPCGLKCGKKPHSESAE